MAEDVNDVRHTNRAGEGTRGLSIRRVFFDPFEKNGVAVIPAARVQGGAAGRLADSSRGVGKGAGGGPPLSGSTHDPMARILDHKPHRSRSSDDPQSVRTRSGCPPPHMLIAALMVARSADSSSARATALESGRANRRENRSS